MTVKLSASGTIELMDDCPSEDAETLLQNLLASPGATVDWRGCHSVHSAVVQILLAVRPTMLGPPASQSLERWIAPLVSGGDRE